MRRRRALGVDGEAAAARAYRRVGYEVVDRNWRCREGELDLVLQGEECLVFCEVKTRSSTAYGSPAAAATAAKQRRIRHLAMRWLDEHAQRAPSIRFDVAAVMDGHVEIVEDAF